MINVTQVEAGLYKAEAGELRFEISKVPGGWAILGVGDASAAVLKQHTRGGTYGTLKGARRLLDDLVELPEIKVLQAALGTAPGSKTELDITGLDPEAVKRLAEMLRETRLSTYISSGTLAVHR